MVLREIQQNPNIIYFWMTKEERDSNQEMLTAEYQRWKNTGYQVCTFISGKGNLPDLTKQLLVRNRKVLADLMNGEYLNPTAEG